ncbi:hypothetical protein ES692_12860 [Psychroserpens burtonensis]|uniref:Uncharacterized protein n=1 Tax=Psychroserpens burtonensis TaxID=49278 RepID=A0A5C7BDZ9_9FLAO|nr:hypothetical protein [Psychroserpens burtonensis]TXE16414.1 hypothetical protein ES692_12860 [Psychroserpens burtonensis]
MKTNIINFVITIILAVLLSLYLPWWSVMVAGFVSALFFSLKKAAVFFVPFLAVFCFWAIYAFIVSSANDFTLAKKIAVLLPLGGNPHVLILVTGLVGGLASGVAAVFGKQLVGLVRK